MTGNAWGDVGFIYVAPEAGAGAGKPAAYAQALGIDPDLRRRQPNRFQVGMFVLRRSRATRLILHRLPQSRDLIAQCHVL